MKPLSPTDLELYLDCPFGFYLQKVLKIEPRLEWEPELTPQEIGSLMHRILERFFSLRTSIQEIADEEFRLIQKNRPALLPFLLSEQKKRIDRTLENFLKETSSQPGSLKPTWFEWSFDGLELPSSEGNPIRLKGRIDRIDVDSNSHRFLVIDYKTGSKKITGQQIQRGEALQLPLYILAVQKLLLPDHEPIGGLYYHLSDLTFESGMIHADRIPESIKLPSRTSSLIPEKIWDSIFEKAAQKVDEVFQKISAGLFPPSPESCHSRCPFKEICTVRASFSETGVE